MKITKQDVISHVVPAIIGIIIGLCLVKCASKPVDSIKIERDTVVVVDTAYYDRPVAKDSVRTRYVTRWLPTKHDTINNTVTMWAHDTVAVEVPITSKHYSGKNYDAYVSGFDVNLDSIYVYNETQYITEIKEITKSVKQKRFGLGINAGYEYDFKDKKFKPCVGIGISYNLVTF